MIKANIDDVSYSVSLPGALWALCRALSWNSASRYDFVGDVFGVQGRLENGERGFGVAGCSAGEAIPKSQAALWIGVQRGMTFGKQCHCGDAVGRKVMQRDLQDRRAGSGGGTGNNLAQ